MDNDNDDFFVICDNTNNSDDDREKGIVNVDIYIKKSLLNHE